MKRIICLLLISLTLLTFCACGAPPALNSAYTGEIRYTDGQTDCTADLSADGDTLRLTITSPGNASGLCCEYRGGELHISLNGLDCITSAECLPASALPSLLYECFSQSAEAEYQGADEGVDTYCLHTRSGDMTVTAEDGIPKTLTYGNRTIRFS